jgi:predicted dehydrogenase
MRFNPSRMRSNLLYDSRHRHGTVLSRLAKEAFRGACALGDRQVKAAVIGVGLLGEQHAGQYVHSPKAELVLVHDANPDRAKAVGESLGVPWTSNLADVAASDAEIVSIATPDHLHHESAVRMLEAGKHLLVEKPLATRTNEAVEIVELSRKNDRKVTINLGNRWMGSFQSIHEAIREGEVGDPVYAYCRCSDTIWVPTQMLSWAGRSGPQWFLFAHTMDLIRWFLGQEAKDVYAVGTKKILVEKGIDAFDAIQAVVNFERTFVTFETSWIIPEAWPAIVEFEITMNGSEGRLGFDGIRQGFELSSDKVGKHMFARPSLWTYFKLPDWWWGSLHDLIDSVLDDREPTVAVEDGAAVTAMIEATERSIAEGRKVDISEMLST